MSAWGVIRGLTASAIVAFSALAVGAAAQRDWLPPDMAAGLSAQLAQRVAQSQPGGKVNLAKARETVDKFAGLIGTWGEKGVTQRAPSLAALKLPPAKLPTLNVVARYQVCNTVLLAQFEGNADASQRAVGALGLTAVTMLQSRVLLPYVERGGKEADVEAFLTGPAFGAVVERVRNDEKAADLAQTECGRVVAEFLALL